AAIDFVKSYLRSEMQVFEFGSGGSTLFFAQQCKSVTSVEDNAHWCEIVAARLARRGIENANVRYLPVAFTGEEEFLASEYLKAVRQSIFDVSVVDGAEWRANVRPHCVRAAGDAV